jgi:hypothetical protein
MSSYKSQFTSQSHIPCTDYPMFPIVWRNSCPVHIRQLKCTSCNCEGDGRQWLKVLYSGRWIGSVGPIASTDLTPLAFFPMGTTEGTRWRSPSQDYRRHHGKTSGSCDNGRCQRVVFESVPCGALPSASKWTEAASNTHFNYEAPVVSSFDCLPHLTLTCILKTNRHRAHAVFLTRFFFKQGI